MLVAQVSKKLYLTRVARSATRPWEIKMYTFKSLKKKSEGKYIGAPSPIFAEWRGGGRSVHRLVCTILD